MQREQNRIAALNDLDTPAEREPMARAGQERGGGDYCHPMSVSFVDSDDGSGRTYSAH